MAVVYERIPSKDDYAAHVDSKLKTGITLLLFVMCALAIFCFDARVDKPKSIDSLEFQSTSNDLNFQISNSDYPNPTSLEYYPWNFLSEPYRTSIIRVNSPKNGAKYSWSITPVSPAADLDLSYTLQNEQGTEITVKFTVAGQLYNVRVDEEGGDDKRSFEAEVICKYVRRELRDLTEDDRGRFLRALKIFHTISKEEGQEKYGERFISHKELTLKHTQQFFTPDGSSCTPWHGGPTFMTTHMAFMLWAEQALQLIDPTIALPYWDYVQDFVTYGYDFSESEIFSDKYMGAYEQYPYQVKGRWNDLEVSTIADPKDTESTRYNSYGVLTDWYNNNDDTRLTRNDKLCGHKPEAYYGLQTCEDIHDVLTSFSLDSAQSYFSKSVHSSNLHEIVGGVWDCAEDYSQIMAEFGDDTDGYHAKYYLELMLFMAQEYWSERYDDGIYADPGFCSTDIDFEECRITCSEISLDEIQTMSDEEVYSYLVKYEFIGVFEDYTSTKNNAEQLILDFVDAETDAKVKRHTLAHYCNPAKMSPFSSPLGASDDPIFYPVHSYFSIYWDYILLTKAPDFDMKWEQTRNCKGHQILDGMPPEWFGFLGETQNKDHSLTYTQFDLLQIFHPTNPKLPYLHTEFNWDYCFTSSFEDQNVKPKMHKLHDS